MSKLKDTVNSLSQLIINGDTLKAMEIFYSNDIVMQENEDFPLKGKAVCIDAERNNLQKVKNIKSTLLNQAIDEEKNVVFSEWEFLVIYNNNNKFLLTEVSVQHWVNGQVAREKFYYKNFQKLN